MHDDDRKLLLGLLRMSGLMPATWSEKEGAGTDQSVASILVASPGASDQQRDVINSLIGGAAADVTFGFELEPRTEDVPRPAAPEVTPEVPGRYRPPNDGSDGLIGKGGFGAVMAVYDAHLHRVVARKELQGSTPAEGARWEGGPPTQQDRFLREARVTARLEHPSIVPVYELGRSVGGKLYYTMKRVRGRTLHSALQDCDTLSERLGLLGHFVSLCQAIAYAHSRGVVHRDLKPLNVMIGEFGETVVLDWGLARLAGHRDLVATELAQPGETIRDGSGLTLGGSVFGTPAYMSPEQALGHVDEIDSRSDVFSLGAVLYEVLTGAPPYGGSDVMAVLRQAAVGLVEPVQDRCADAPAELAAIALRAMAVDPKERYASARELASEVEAWRTGGHVGAYQYSRQEIVARLVRRFRVPLLIGVAATLGFSIAGVTAYLEVRTERDRAILAELKSASAERQARSRLAGSLAEAATAAFVRGDRVSAHVLALGSLDLVESPEARGALVASTASALPKLSGQTRVEGACVVPTLASDGALACWSEGGIRVWPSFPGQSTLVPIERATARDAWSISWSPSGARIAAVAYDGALWMWHRGDPTPRRSRVEGTNMATFVSEQALLVTDEDGRIGTFEIDSGRDPKWSTERAPVRFDWIAPLESGAVVVGSIVGPIRLWNPKRDTWKTLSENVGAPMVAASRDGSVILAGGGWGGAVSPVRLLENGRVKQLGEPVQTLSLGASEDGRRLFVASQREVTIWDDPRWPVVSRIPSDAALDGAAMSADGRTLIVTETDGDVRRWSLPAISGSRPVDAGGTVWDVQATDDGSSIVSAGNDGWLRVWDSETGELRAAWQLDPTGIGFVVLAGRDAVVTASRMGLIRVSIDTGEIKWTTAYDGVINDLKPARDGKALVTDAEGDISLISLEDGATVWTTHADRLASSAHDDGRGGVVVAGDLLALWLDGAYGNVTRSRTVPDLTYGVFPLGDGTLVASQVGKALHMDSEGRDIGEWGGAHAGRLSTLTPHGNIAAGGGDDGDICVWTVTGVARACWPGHGANVWRVAFSPDERWIASGGADGSMRRWSLDALDSVVRDGLEGAVTHLGLRPGDGRVIEVEASEMEAR